MVTHAFEKQSKKRLSLKTQFEIEFLLSFTGSRKALEKNPEGDCQFLEKYIFKVLSVFSGLNLKFLFTDLCLRWNLHSEIGLNEKKKIKS